MTRQVQFAVVGFVLTLLGGCAGTSSRVVTLSSGQEFQEATAGTRQPGEQPALVEFYSVICPACSAAELKVDQLANDYAGRVRFYRIESGPANSAGLLHRYGITGVPTFIAFVNGQEAGRVRGNQDIREYRDLLDNAVNSTLSERRP